MIICGVAVAHEVESVVKGHLIDLQLLQACPSVFGQDSEFLVNCKLAQWLFQQHVK